ncbi:MAG: tripartite tricarboxylate transporter substrate binding protein [Alphaproteobacteria bacterium]|nr:tripartite tricarboxylate transporter substrate binding protein [Alphaproteobacteria bacterium]
MRRRTFIVAAGAAAAVPGIAPSRIAPARAQAPARTVRLVVPFAPGGSVDLAARLLAEPLGARLGQNVIVDNRAGAGGAIGADLVAKAPGDGATLLWGSSAVVSIAAALRRNLAYNPTTDLAPVSLVVRTWHGLLASPKLEAADARAAIALARARPGALNAGSGGTGSATHLLIERLKAAADIDLVHVPYRGSGAVYPDLANGLVHLMFESLPVALAQTRAGGARLLAVTAPERSRLSPDTPTLLESGVPGFVTSAWFGVLAPAAMPEARRAELAAAIRAVTEEPTFRRRAGDAGLDVVGSDPAAFARMLAEETEAWRDVQRRTGLMLD